MRIRAWIGTFALILASLSTLVIAAPTASAVDCTPSISKSGSTYYVTFTSGSGCYWTVPQGVTSVSYLVVGGGGGGGGARTTTYPNLGAGGGGGGGKVMTGTLTVSPNANMGITVGAGGSAGAVGSNGGNGGASQLDYGSPYIYTATGGYAGAGANGTYDQANLSGDGGASGGGNGGGANDWDGGGGGGGAGGAGSNGIDIGGQGGTGGAGGAGVANSISGTSIYYGAGGGGGGTPSTNSNETDGNGGAGGTNTGGAGGGGPGNMPTSGTANTGAGGGGGGWRSTNSDAQRAGAAGSAGVIILQFTKTAASISSFSISSNAGSDLRYKIGDVVSVQAIFTETVIVTGSPRIQIQGLSSKYATYASGSNSTTLTFSYTVAAGDSDPDGISFTAGSLSLNGGTIRDVGQIDATYSNGAITTAASHRIDGVVPTISTANTISIAENTTSVLTLAASETVTWAISGGADQVRFTVETSTGVLTITARDFETPQSQAGTNTYVVNLVATDLAGNASTALVLSVTITNVNEYPVLGTLSLNANPAKGNAVTLTISVDIASTVTFSFNGKRVAGCINRATTGTAPSLTATCTWKPAVQGKGSLVAVAKANVGGYVTTSAELSTYVLRRSGNR
jgi:hypothetical protein